MADTSPQGLARQLLVILYEDTERLQTIDDYLHGNQNDPYMPATADAEYKLLAERAISNLMGLAVATPAQALYVDSFRPGRIGGGLADRATNSLAALNAQGEADSPEWTHWQRSRMDAKQLAVHRGALSFGHSFTVTVKDPRRGVITKGLSAMNTAALFEDAANDDTPFAALTVAQYPKGDKVPGKATLWDGTYEYAVTFEAFGPDPKVKVQAGKRHGASECPVTRFAAHVDLEGRTTGIVEPLIALQDRINQTVFDLLVAQTYGSFKVRWVTGMAPPLIRDPETGEPELDEHGNPRPAPINHNARRFLFAEDDDVKFGSLDETPLQGFIESIDMSIRHFSAIGQIPPHHLLGQIANLSAEALQAAETSLLRMIEEFKKSFGESWERVFRLAAELSGEAGSMQDFSGEVVWRDMEGKSLSQTADGLGKLKDQLEVPPQGLWRRIPGVTQNELAQWEELKAQEPVTQLADAVHRSVPTRSSSVPAAADALAQ